MTAWIPVTCLGPSVSKIMLEVVNLRLIELPVCHDADGL